MKKKTATAMALVLALGMAGSLVACGEKAPEGFTQIRVSYDASFSNDPYYLNMFKEYNATQGKEDLVYVVPELGTGSASSSENDMKSGVCDAYMISLGALKSAAINGAIVNLQPYLDADKTGIYDESKIPERTLNHYKITVDPTYKSHVAGKGQDTYALPFTNQPHVLFYSKDAFARYNINEVSCEEEKLAAQYPNLKPHGYAEYAEEPFAGAKSSQNLAGETVYKVFNNRIPMNWEEFRYLAKCLTRTGHNSSAINDWGFATTWWFEYGFSVGADCIGWNNQTGKYEFTLGDDTPNWLVTAKSGVTVGETDYACGDVLFYEDKAAVTQEGGKTLKAEYQDKLYAMPSASQAITEFLKITNSPNGAKIDGYGVADRGIEAYANALTSGQIAMTAVGSEALEGVVSGMRNGFDMAPVYQYRKYEGGSVYYKDGTGFKNEYLKVIGKTYDEGKYEGELVTHNETPIIGRASNFNAGTGFAIASGASQENRDAAYKFIRWAAGPQGQKKLAEGMFSVPNQLDLAFSADYLDSTEFTGIEVGKINWYATSYSVVEGGMYDGEYFETSEWISDPNKGWSNDFNNKLRVGLMTLDEFIAANKANADELLANMNIRIVGKK